MYATLRACEPRAIPARCAALGGLRGGGGPLVPIRVPRYRGNASATHRVRPPSTDRVRLVALTGYAGREDEGRHAGAEQVPERDLLRRATKEHVVSVRGRRGSARLTAVVGAHEHWPGH